MSYNDYYYLRTIMNENVEKLFYIALAVIVSGIVTSRMVTFMQDTRHSTDRTTEFEKRLNSTLDEWYTNSE